MGVDLQADVLLPEAKAVQERRVDLGRQHRRLADVSAQRLPEWGFARDLDRGHVRGVIVVGGDLHGELTGLRQCGGEPGQERLVVGDPVQRGVGEDEVVVSLARERADVSLLEAETVAREGRALGQHRRRVVDADRLPRREPPVQLPRQLAGAAAEIDDAHSRPRLHQIEQIEEGLRPLVAEPPVLLRIPVG